MALRKFPAYPYKPLAMQCTIRVCLVNDGQKWYSTGMKDQTAASAKRKQYDSDLTDAQSRSGRVWRMLPPRPAAVADHLYLLPNVEVRRNAEARPRRPPRRSPPSRRTQPRTRRGGHRQPERANHRIREDRGYDAGKNVEDTSEAWIRMAMICLTLRRLAT